jgi:porphobilinogen synthase
MNAWVPTARATFPVARPRRLRARPELRALVRETAVTPRSLIAPLFVCAGQGIRRDVPSMPGCVVESVDVMLARASRLAGLGVGGVLLFGAATRQDEHGTEAARADAAVPTALAALRESVPGLTRWADVCLCAYTTHGHCGVLANRADGTPDVDNDRTLDRLSEIAVAYARAGADVVAPSDMMDGRVSRIRAALDEAGQSYVAICSYAVKFASALYGPFRDAAASRPAFGDRRTYQLDPANGREALREAALDVAEGADLLLVKPALGYLDVVQAVQASFGVPTVAYSVSGEYAMVKAAAAQGWIDEDATMLEMLVSMKRAGADLIVSYFAEQAAQLLVGGRE